MNKINDFLQECGIFYLLTVKNNCPMGRPFGAIMEHNGDLYFSTANFKEVYRQISANPNVQIVALKNGTRQWIRISGKATECTDREIKGKMMNIFPVLQNHFKTAENESFALFKLVAEKADLHTETGVMNLV